MKKFSFFTILSLIALGGIMIFSGSCNKPKPCKAIITVMDTTGSAVQAGVLVQLKAYVTTATGSTKADLETEGVTDASGKIEFTLKLPAIMDVFAKKPNCTVTSHTYTTNGTYVPGSYCEGKAIVKFEEGETAEKTVYLKY